MCGNAGANDGVAWMAGKWYMAMLLAPVKPKMPMTWLAVMR